MKKILLSLLAFAAAIGAGAQVVEVQSVEQVPVADLSVNVARVSPDGSFAVVSSNAGNVLYRVDLASGEATNLNTKGNAQSLVFSPDGNTVIYKTSATAKNRLRYHSIEALDLSSGKVSALTQPSRNIGNYVVAPSGNLTVAADGKIQARNAAGQAVEESAPVVGIYRGHLQLTKADGEQVYLDPQGKGSYLWPSISPDGSKISYYFSGDGCYVCDLDGSNVRRIGYVHAPAWLGNDRLVGQQDTDNGEVILTSAIVVADLQGTIQSITDSSLICMYPAASADGSKIVFTTTDGKLYQVNLK